MTIVTERLTFKNNSGGVLQWRNNTPANIYFTVTRDVVPPPDPDYDVQGAVDVLFQGLVIQRTLREGAEDYYVSVGRPLADGDIPAILAAANVLNAAQELADYVPSTQPDYPLSLPPYPTGLPRFPDSDGGMQSTDGWCITTDGKVVFG